MRAWVRVAWCVLRVRKVSRVGCYCGMGTLVGKSAGRTSSSHPYFTGLFLQFVATLAWDNCQEQTDNLGQKPYAVHGDRLGQYVARLVIPVSGLPRRPSDRN